MALIALLSALSSAVRAIAAVFCGKYGDKYGFMRLLNISYILLAIGFFVNIFTVPENGKLLFTLYMVITGLSTAGTAIADSNLIFEYASLETRVGVLAIKGTVCGILSFAVTLAMSFLVSHIQESGNTFLGINVYAQQVTSAIAFVGTIVLLIYVNTVAKTAKRST
jgi:MFS family permease